MLIGLQRRLVPSGSGYLLTFAVFRYASLLFLWVRRNRVRPGHGFRYTALGMQLSGGGGSMHGGGASGFRASFGRMGTRGDGLQRLAERVVQLWARLPEAP
jgi:hypothetical protein